MRKVFNLQNCCGGMALTDSERVLIRNEGVVDKVVQRAQAVWDNLLIAVLQLIEDVLRRVS